MSVMVVGLLMEIPTRELSTNDRGDDVRKLHNYLETFGYIKTRDNEKFGARLSLEKAAPRPRSIEVFDDNTTSAIMKFQEFNGLPITGVLDAATLDLMSKPRCGNPDLVEGQQIDFTKVGWWNWKALSFRFENFTGDLAQNNIRIAINFALNQWASVAPLTFTEATSGGDIRIAWAVGDHGDGKPFDGPSTEVNPGVVAHGFYPQNGRLHFDDDETWTDLLRSMPRPVFGQRDIDLPSVALHELGHILGLGHSSDTNAVMYGYYMGRRRTLQTDDIAGIRSIYGIRTGTIWHTIRFPTTWQPWGNVWVTVRKNPGAFKSVACASIGNDLHVIGLTNNGKMYHTIRFPTTWQDWGNVSARKNPGAFKSVACASIAQDVHVIGLTNNGKMYHTIRFPTTPTTWQDWGNVSATVRKNPGAFKSVACASIAQDVHVIGLTNNGKMYHTIRFPTTPTTWQDWGNVSDEVEQYPGPFKSVDCASISQNVHVVGRT
jgi:peptidoglycan hydrolase-like protein with peptidoglycan-binding domain